MDRLLEQDIRAFRDAWDIRRHGTISEQQHTLHGTGFCLFGYHACARLVYGANIDPAPRLIIAKSRTTIVINDETPVDCQNTIGGTAWPGTPATMAAPYWHDTWSANCACSGVGVDCAAFQEWHIIFPGSAVTMATRIR